MSVAGCISGFTNFVWHRFARIWPLHFVTLVGAVLYLGHKYGVAYVSPSAVIANLFLVHGWGHYFPPPLNFPSWSLSDEWGAYLVLPFYLFVITRIRSRVVHVLLIVVLFMGLTWYANAFGHGTLDQLRERGGLERCLFQVGIGVSLFQLYCLLKGHNDLQRSKLLSRVFDAAAALIFIAIFLVFTYTNNDLYFVPLAGALIFCLSLSHGPFSNFLSLRPMVLLGEISFSIYMLHAFVLWIFQDIPLSYKAHLGWWTGAFLLFAEHLLVLVLAYFSYKGIERPAHRLLVRR